MSRPLQHLQDPLRSLSLDNVEETGKTIGRGAYGVVSEVKVSGLVCAGKTLHEAIVQVETLDKFKEECLCHSQQRHPNIVQLMGVHFIRNNRLPMLVMEYLPQSLTQCLESHRDLPLQIKYSILLDVANGLNYLHCKRPPIVHRDLTANNILLTSNFVAKISDLGVSRMADTFKRQQLSVAPGNCLVMPPEALKDNPVYDHKLDVFSYGCLILHVFTHEWPKPSDQYVPKTGIFRKGNFTLVNEWKRRERFTSAISNDNPFYLFANSCLENDPKKRPTMSGAIMCAQNAVSSLRPLKNQFEIMKVNNALRKQVDQLEKRVQDIHELEERNKAQTNAYLLDEVMEQTQSYTQRLEQENKIAQDTINLLQQQNKKIQAQAHQMEQEKKKVQENVNQLQQEKEKADAYIYQLEQEKKIILSQACGLRLELKQSQQDVQQEKIKACDITNQLKEEKKKIQSDADVLKEGMEQALEYGHRLEKEKERVQTYAKTLELEKKQTEEIVLKLEQEKKMTQEEKKKAQKMKQVQKVSFITVIVIVIAILLYKIAI